MVENNHWNSCFLLKTVCSCFTEKIYLLVDYFSNMVRYSVYDMGLLVKYEHCSCRTLVNDPKHLTCFCLICITCFQRKSLEMNAPDFSFIYSFNLFFMLLEKHVRAVCCLSYCFFCKYMLIFLNNYFNSCIYALWWYFTWCNWDVSDCISILYLSIKWSPCFFVPWTDLCWTT